MPSIESSNERIADALERIAIVLEEQHEMVKVPMLDAATVLKSAAEEVASEGSGP